MGREVVRVRGAGAVLAQRAWIRLVISLTLEGNDVIAMGTEGCSRCSKLVTKFRYSQSYSEICTPNLAYLLIAFNKSDIFIQPPWVAWHRSTWMLLEASFWWSYIMSYWCCQWIYPLCSAESQQPLHYYESLRLDVQFALINASPNSFPPPWGTLSISEASTFGVWRLWGRK